MNSEPDKSAEKDKEAPKTPKKTPKKTNKSPAKSSKSVRKGNFSIYEVTLTFFIRNDTKKDKTSASTIIKKSRRKKNETAENGLLFAGKIIAPKITTLKKPSAVTLQNA